MAYAQTFNDEIIVFAFSKSRFNFCLNFSDNSRRFSKTLLYDSNNFNSKYKYESTGSSTMRTFWPILILSRI